MVGCHNFGLDRWRVVSILLVHGVFEAGLIHGWLRESFEVSVRAQEALGEVFRLGIYAALRSSLARWIRFP